MTRLLLDWGADANARDEYNQTPLMCASLKGHKEIVRLLLDRGADVNVKTRSARTALNLASDQGQREIAEMILEKEPVLWVCQCQVKGNRYNW